MALLALRQCFATVSCPVFFPLRREILESGEDKDGPVTGVPSPGMQRPLWELDSFPASPGLKDFSRKMSICQGPPAGRGWIAG